MSDILSRLRSAHDKRRMVRVDVPEYDLELYFPPFTLRDHEVIRRGVRKGDEHEISVNALMHMAHDAEGKKVFDVPAKDRPALKAELQKMELHVLQRIMRKSGGGVSDSAAAELQAIDEVALRAAMVSAVGEDAPVLTEMLKASSEGVLVAALAELVEDYEAAQPVKNG